jgi:ABC-type transport system involved in multi-copper enzyme maturation permease subunit
VTGFARLFAFDWRLLHRRALFRTIEAATVLAAILAVFAGGGHDASVHSGAWLPLSQAISVVMPLLLASGAVLGAVSLSGDAASGSLRAVLTRPVSRSAIVLSRAAALGLALFLVYGASLFVAFLCASSRGDFDGVTFGELATPVAPREDLVRAANVAFMLGFPAILCATMIGLMLSTWWNDPALSAVCALMLVLAPYLAEVLRIASGPWIFTHGTVFGASVLAEFASGDTTRLGIISDGRNLLVPFLVPLGGALVAIAAGCAVFSRRDFKG